MSAEEHRAQAQRERNAAAEHDGKYDPRATEEILLAGSEGLTYDTVTYNPTDVHAERANTHRAHAEEHEAAAAALEQFEAAECKAFPPQTRKACPLLATVEKVAEIDGGVHVELTVEIDRDAVLAHTKCHLAFARAKGRSGMAACPLYLEGVSAKAGTGKHSIDLAIADEALLPELRKRTRAHAGP